MEGKYLYFRTIATVADDDATGDSACFPASSLMGMQPTADTTLVLYFKNMLRGSGNHGYDTGTDGAQYENYDSVELTIPANTHAVAMKAIASAISGPNFPSFIVVADDRTGVTEYLSGSGITACRTISVAVEYAHTQGVCCAEE